MPDSKIHVVVDDRELKSKVARFLDQMDNTIVTIRRLPVGDYLVNNLLLFERKTFADFAASIKDGRLFMQARRLAASRSKGVFVLEGKTGDFLDSRMSREAIQGALITLSLIFGIPLLRAKDASESARLIVYAANQIQKQADGGVPRHVKRPKGKRKAQLNLLQGISDIGPERAKRLLEKFGSVEQIFTADMNDLISVAGIGLKTARAIRWVVG